MGQDLNCRIGVVIIWRHTELGTDVICSHSCVISGENNIGEVPALLGHILNKISGFEVRLRDSKVENSLSSWQVHWNGGIDASLCGGSSSKHCQNRDGRKLHCEGLTKLIYDPQRVEETISLYESHHLPWILVGTCHRRVTSRSYAVILDLRAGTAFSVCRIRTVPDLSAARVPALKSGADQVLSNSDHSSWRRWDLWAEHTENWVWNLSWE